MNKFKYIIILVISTLLLTSCADYEAITEDLLKERYAETFTIIKRYPFSVGSATFLAKSNQYPDLPFKVTLTYSGKQNSAVEDTYGSRRISKKLSEYIKNKIDLQNTDSQIYVHYEKMIPFLEQDPDEDLDKFLTDDEHGSLFFIICGNNNQDTVEKIKTVISDLGNLRAVVWIFECDEEMLNKVKIHLQNSYNLASNEGYELFRELRFENKCITYQLKDGNLELDNL